MVSGLVAVAGCAASTPGELCPMTSTQCAGGLVCDRWAVYNTELPYRCLLGCERRSDCPGESICQGAQVFARLDARGVCDTWGDLREGEMCNPTPEDLCGPGLTCNAQVGGWNCVPSCDAFSPHSEDRRCPPGWLCHQGGSAFAPDPSRVCVRMCDLATRDGCAQFEACLRVTHPEEGEIGVCLDPALYSCGACPFDQVCAEGGCFDPLEAPPLPWIVSSEIPPLVD